MQEKIFMSNVNYRLKIKSNYNLNTKIIHYSKIRKNRQIKNSL